MFKRSFTNTPQKINMEPGNDGFKFGITFSKGPFSSSMFVLGGVRPSLEKTLGKTASGLPESDDSFSYC